MNKKSMDRADLSIHAILKVDQAPGLLLTKNFEEFLNSYWAVLTRQDHLEK